MNHPSSLLRSSLLVVVLLLMGTVSLGETLKLSGPVFGTTYSVKARNVEPNGSEQDVVEAALARVDQLMSTYRDDSDVSRFNAAQSTEWFPVAEETAKVVAAAQSISALTEGGFDITVGPLVGLWNFGAAGNGADAFEVPSEEQLNKVLERVGYQKLEVRQDPPALRKSTPDLQVDLSAIAKGYAVDVVFEALSHLEHCMVEVGGEVRARGKSDIINDVSWRIGIEAPTKGKREVDSIVNVADEAMATSGDYRNFFVHEGRTYSHTIDPKTGRPVEHDLASATVLAPDCMTADALATAMLVLGPNRAQEFANANQVKALLVRQTPDTNELERITSDSFPTLDVQPTAQKQQAESNSSVLGMFVATGVIFGLAVLAMSLGTILANRRIQGSCGGMAGLKDAGGKTICDMCTKPSPECTGEAETAEAADAVS